MKKQKGEVLTILVWLVMVATGAGIATSSSDKPIPLEDVVAMEAEAIRYGLQHKIKGTTTIPETVLVPPQATYGGFTDWSEESTASWSCGQRAEYRKQQARRGTSIFYQYLTASPPHNWLFHKINFPVNKILPHKELIAKLEQCRKRVPIFMRSDADNYAVMKVAGFGGGITELKCKMGGDQKVWNARKATEWELGTTESCAVPIEKDS